MNIWKIFQSVHLSTPLGPDIPSYNSDVENGIRRDTKFARLIYLLKANYAYNYMRIRGSSNDPRQVSSRSKIERAIKYPFGILLSQTSRAKFFLRNDYYFEGNIIDTRILQCLTNDLLGQNYYYDPYVAERKFLGPPEKTANPILYMENHVLFKNVNFLSIAATPSIANFCREVLGPSATIVWAWAWLSQPADARYENQNWHRDNYEPFNFIRVFIPLSDIENTEDGPTEIIPGTSELPRYYELRRFSHEEITPLIATNKNHTIFACRGDVYFVNTFALHKGTPPKKQRAMLSLLVSLSPSHRTPSIETLSHHKLPPELRAAIRKNKKFFRYLVD